MLPQPHVPLALLTARGGSLRPFANSIGVIDTGSWPKVGLSRLRGAAEPRLVTERDRRAAHRPPCHRRASIDPESMARHADSDHLPRTMGDRLNY